jgi:hypothetical protein
MLEQLKAEMSFAPAVEMFSQFTAWKLICIITDMGRPQIRVCVWKMVREAASSEKKRLSPQGITRRS